METHSASQIIHYAKGRFRRGELFKDLQVLVGDYAAIPPGHVSYGGILNVLCDVALPFLFASHNPQHYLSAILMRLGGTSVSGHLTDLVVLELLSILKLIRVKDGDQTLVMLAEPNPDLLPLAD